MTQKKIVHAGPERDTEEWIDLARNLKERLQDERGWSIQW